MPASLGDARRPASGGASATTPSASSTSAEPELDDAARLPCLTTRRPVAGDDDRGHRRDVDRVQAVAAGAHDVDRLGPGTSMRCACSSMTSASPRSSSTVSPLARRATRNPASCTGVASPVMTSAIAQRACSAERSSPAQEGGEQVRPGGPAGVGVDTPGQPTATRCRARSAMASETAIGSRGCDTTPSASDQPASQPSCGRPMSTQDRGALEDLVLQLAAQPEATRRGSPRRRGRRRRAHRRPCASMTASAVAHSRHADDLDVARGAPPGRRPHGVAGRDVVAVERGPTRGGRRRSPRPAPGVPAACEEVMRAS